MPLELYRKRYHAENEHVKWSRWPVEKRINAWTVHCADMLEQAMLVDATPQEPRLSVAGGGRTAWFQPGSRVVMCRRLALTPALNACRCSDRFLEGRYRDRARALHLPAHFA